MPFDIDSARKAGYNDAEIGDFLSKQNANFDVGGAIKAGYSVDEIASKLNKPSVGQTVSGAVSSVTNNPAYAENPMVGAFRADQGLHTLADKGGGLIAKSLSNMGLDPNMAVAVGKAFSSIPTMAEMAAGSNPGVEGGKAVLNAASAATGALKEGLGGVVDAVKGTGNDAVAALTERQASLPLQQAAKKASLAELKTQAGAAIQAAEKKAGIGLSDTSTANIRSMIDTPAKITSFADKAGSLADKGAETLSQKATTNVLQMYRKAAEQAIEKAGPDMTPGALNKLYQTKQVFTDAIGLQHPEFAEAMGRYKDVVQAEKAMPGLNQTETLTNQLATVKAQNLARKQAAIRKGLGVAAVTGVGRKILKGMGD